MPINSIWTYQLFITNSPDNHKLFCKIGIYRVYV